MTPDFYQKIVKETANGDGDLLVNWALGIGGETGEVVEHIKKHRFHGKPLDLWALKLELGDLLWYVAMLCNETGLSLDDVMQTNVNKLKKRYPNGFQKGRTDGDL